MKNKLRRIISIYAAAAAIGLAASLIARAGAPAGAPPAAVQPTGPGVVQCANLIYGQDKSSVCFSDEFLAQIQKDTHIRTNRRFCPVKADSPELYQYPFAVMTGEGSFALTATQRANLRNYFNRGGFLVASAGCSSSPWDASFRAEIHAIFPDRTLQRIPMTHPIFHTVYDVTKLDTTHSGGSAFLEGLEIDGKIVLIYSHEGLNDTPNAGPGCCCCGGNEIRNSRQINANLLAYALTH